MSGFPGQLYRFNVARDYTGAALELGGGLKSGTVAATSVPTASFVVPADRAFILHAAFIYGAAGAGQAVQILRIELLDHAGNWKQSLQFHRFSAGNQFETANFSGEVYLPPQMQFRAWGGFDAGALANYVELNVWGVLIPRANFQLAGLDSV